MTQLTSPFSNTWFTPEFGDYFGNGPEFWLASRCLLGTVAGSTPSDLGSNAVSTAAAYATALSQRLYQPGLLSPIGWRAFTAKKWVAGRLAVPLFGAASANPIEAADLAVGHALTIVGKCGESAISKVFRLSDHRLYDGYLLTVPMRRAVLMFESWMRGNPGLSDSEVRDLAEEVVAKSNFLGWAQPQHWLVRATPWLACQGRTPEFFYWLLAAADILEKSAPDNWVAQQMMVALVSGLPPIGDHTPGAIAFYALWLAKTLEAASAQAGSLTTDSSYCWLATMVLAELVRASQAQWSPDEMAEAAEAAAQVTADFLQVVNAWPSV